VALQDDKLIGRGNSAADPSGSLGVEQNVKRLLEIAAAAIGLILFSPLLLMASIAIKLDSPGRVLVRESRYGHKNRPIQVLRFRVVEVGAESNRSELQLTRVGRILSQTGIDELPAVVNVLRGDLSIIGPRPSVHPKTSLNRAKPGILEWAQIIVTREQPPDADPN
jgi:lipopolysaccharide/colanic/teichoic acid biosynthesis glycosyltransferase